jgi:hypothetical protein
MWELWSRDVPWKDKSHTQIISSVGFRGVRLSVPISWPERVQDVVTRCFQEPTSRPSFSVLVDELELIMRAAQMEHRNVPRAFLCPISQRVMWDPVMCADCQTYERDSIQTYFQTTGSLVSPVTGDLMNNRSVKPNNALRLAIREFYEQDTATGTHPNSSQVTQCCSHGLSS